MEQESIEFAVTINGTYWDKKPQFSIWVDNHVVVQTEVSHDSLQTHKFTRILDEGDHTLSIKLENKTETDTQKINEEIVKDMLLNIVDITIDDISLGQLLWTESTFLLETPQEYEGNNITQLDSCVNLGWNGTYVLKFTSPFYIWLLEKL